VASASRNEIVGVPSEVTWSTILFRPLRSISETPAVPSLSGPITTRRRLPVASVSENVSPTMWFFESLTPASWTN